MEDVRNFKFWLAVAYEFLGTFLMVMVSIGSSSYPPEDKSPRGMVRTPFAVGLSVGVVIWSGLHISGAHVNPVVSFGLLITHKIRLIRFILYSLFQILGAITASYLIKFVSPPGFNDLVGAQVLGEGVTWYQGFLIEVLTTFLLILVIFATFDTYRPYRGGSGALMIGLSVTLLHLWAVSGFLIFLKV